MKQDEQKGFFLDLRCFKNPPSLRGEVLVCIDLVISPMLYEEDEETSNAPFFLLEKSACETRKFIPWVPDYASEACIHCSVSFSVVVRRHHCRYCGNLFCSSCAKEFLLLPLSFELETPQRVCLNCAEELYVLQPFLSLHKQDKSKRLFFQRQSSSKISNIQKDLDISMPIGVGTHPLESNLSSIKIKDAELSITIFLNSQKQPLGQFNLSLSFLLSKMRRKMMLFNSRSQLIVRNKQFLPTVAVIEARDIKNVSNSEEDLNESNRITSKSNQESEVFEKHVFMITRGTRGDVQPFLALARGLANGFGFKVTILTEMRFKKFVENNSKVHRGKVSFRPVGGDTQSTVDSRLGKWAVSLKSDVMNTLMLSRSEVQFFDSEPAVFYYAKEMKPDLLIFGFTMAAVTMTVSEALNIPLMGFVLQPTCIPSERFPPVFPLDQQAYEKLKELSSAKSSHKYFSHMKEIFENNPLTGHLNVMRTRRSLKKMTQTTEGEHLLVNAVGALGYPTTNKTWPELTRKNIPLVIPINPRIFGPKPELWSENTVLTDNIFMDIDALPPLEEQLQNFIKIARQRDLKLVVLAFSSMPVTRHKILSIAVKLIKEVHPRTAIVAMVAQNHTKSKIIIPTAENADNLNPNETPDDSLSKSNNSLESLPSSISFEESNIQDIWSDNESEGTLKSEKSQMPDVLWPARRVGKYYTKEKRKRKIEQLAEHYISAGRLFLVNKAPFGRLFPLMDCIVCHGGLGTTGDAIMSAVPVIITGVLLFDQRFWGVRCQELQIGPYPVHINNFKDCCVEYVSKALSLDSPWKENARHLAAALHESRSNHDGVDFSGERLNANKIVEMLPKAVSYEYVPPEGFLQATIEKWSSFGKSE